MKYFWDTVETIDKSECDGFPFFGWEHLLWLAMLLAAFVAFALTYRKFNDKVRHIFRIVFVAFLVFLEIVRYVSIYSIGVPLVRYAPVQLCHICLYLAIIHCILGGCSDRDGVGGCTAGGGVVKVRHYIGNFLYLVGIPAGLSALLFPAWHSLPAFCSCSSLYSFISHGLVVMYIIGALAAGEIKRDPRTIWISVIALFIMAAGVYTFDIYTGLNFMFLVRLSPGSPLAPFEKLGDYRLGYLIILAVLVLILYGLPWVIGKVRHRK